MKKILMKKILMKKTKKILIQLLKNFYNFLHTYIKMVNKYYQKKKEKLRKEARERYQNFSEEEKEKRRKKAWDRCKNLSEEEKEKKVEYMRNYYLAHKK